MRSEQLSGPIQRAQLEITKEEREEKCEEEKREECVKRRWGKELQPPNTRPLYCIHGRLSDIDGCQLLSQSVTSRPSHLLDAMLSR